MSAKSKLTLALLSATAIFTFNPGIVTRILSGEEVRANEIVLDQSITNDLNVLSLDSHPAVETNAVNLALALPGQQVEINTTTAPTTDDNVAPGENPFVKTVKKQVPVSVAPVESVPATRDAKTETHFNPFSEPSVAKATKSDTPTPVVAKVDDSALRYYAANKDLKRLGAELRRLKSLFPDWEPPKDLFAPVTDISEQPLWDIYKTGDFSRVRAEIALIQSTNPKWVPSDDLMAKLQLGETRALINRAFAQGRWQEVIGTAQASPTILVCSEMQVIWNVAEAFAQTKNYAQSFDLYRYVLSSCDDPQLRLSTVQKASLLLPAKGAASLMALGRVNADGTTEFQNVGFDGLRRQIGDYIQNGDFASTPSEEELKSFVDFVQRTESGQDAALIGWYFYAQEDWKTSNSWFVEAAKYERSAKHIEGIILTLRKMDQPEQAHKLARKFIKASPEVADQYIEIVASEMTAEKPTLELQDKELDDFEKTVNDRKSALGAQALGWKYLAASDKDRARNWFTDSVSWKPTEGGVIGLAVMASRAKNYKELAALKSKYGTEYAALSDFKVFKGTSKTKKTKRIVEAKEEAPAPKKKRKFFLFSSQS